MNVLNHLLTELANSPFGTALTWGIPQLVLAALTILAARRHKLLGLWVVAIAMTLAFFNRVAVALVMRFGHPTQGDLGSLNSYPTFLVLLILMLGWAMLAFTRGRSSRRDA